MMPLAQKVLNIKKTPCICRDCKLSNGILHSLLCFCDVYFNQSRKNPLFANIKISAKFNQLSNIMKEKNILMATGIKSNDRLNGDVSSSFC